MTLEQIIPTCPNCSSELKKIKGPYGMFWGCGNYKECGFKGFSAEKERRLKDKPQAVRGETGNAIIMEELAGINKRLDDMGRYLKSKLG